MTLLQCQGISVILIKEPGKYSPVSSSDPDTLLVFVVFSLCLLVLTVWADESKETVGTRDEAKGYGGYRGGGFGLERYGGEVGRKCMMIFALFSLSLLMLTVWAEENNQAAETEDLKAEATGYGGYGGGGIGLGGYGGGGIGLGGYGGGGIGLGGYGGGGIGLGGYGGGFGGGYGGGFGGGYGVGTFLAIPISVAHARVVGVGGYGGFGGVGGAGGLGGFGGVGGLGGFGGVGGLGGFGGVGGLGGFGGVGGLGGVRGYGGRKHHKGWH
ncbi:uncharacterized protein LOC143250365 [Tachypleus tridentatus]|uniref:uncharacterized protein LOC143250365 n=1 Tax=Tachypleus tridentatus TaxID=6853 RepID=UPI003FD3B104